MTIAVSVKTAITGGSGSVDIDHGVGNDRALIVLAFEERNPNTLDTATFDGDAPTYTGTAYTSSNCRLLPMIWNDAALPAGSGSFTLTSDATTGAGTHYLIPIYLTGVDQASIGAPVGITGGTAKASPISQAVSGASAGHFCVIAAIDSTASSSNSLLSDCTFAADTAVSAQMFVAVAYSLLTATVGFTSDDTYEGWTAFALAPASSAPALTDGTPTGTLGTQTTATLGATTNQTTGTLYGVVTTASLTGVTATQVKAGQNASGSTSGVSSDDSAVSTTTPSIGVTGLTAGTVYNYAVVQNNANGDSNVVIGSFTTAAASLTTSLTIVDAAGANVASTSLTWWLRQGDVIVASGMTSTNGSGLLSLSVPAASVGAATLYYQNADNTLSGERVVTVT